MAPACTDVAPRRARRRSPRRALGTLLLTVALTGGATLGATSAQAAEPGVNISPSSSMTDLKALGTHWVRVFISWRTLQPTPGPIVPSALSSYETFFRSLPAGSKVLVDVLDTPQWETGSADEHAPPANPGDYAAFVATLAARWGTQVSAWEIWNEEDSATFWSGGADAAAYTQLLKAAYPAIKAANPKATVVLGGLTGNDYTFLEGVYAAGGKGYFDAVGVHTDTACDVLSPYDFLREGNGRMSPDSFLAYREVHAVMLANGDDKPIWMTELSWRTTEATCSEGAWAGMKSEGVSEEQQATYLSQAYHCLAQDAYVQVALWFPMEDEGSVISGLVRADGSRKPSFAAMRSYAKEGDKLSEECGVFTGPAIVVASPANHTSYNGPLPIHVTASSKEGVFRIRLEVDGKLIRNYDGNSFPTTLTGVLDWQGAKHISPGWHTLTFLAYDKERNVSQTSVMVYHGSSASGNASGGRGHGKSLRVPKHARKHTARRRRRG